MNLVLPSKAAEVSTWLSNHDHILLVSHQRPDGDALGSLFAMTHCLRAMGKQPIAYVEHELPERYRSYAPENLVIGESVPIAQYDALIALDCANHPRLALPNAHAFDDIPLPSYNIDHHVDNGKYGDHTLIVPQSAATCEIVCALAQHTLLPCTDDAATAMLLGIVSDTGGFRFANTSSTTMVTTAWLMENGADYNRVMSDIFFNDPIEQLRLQARIFDKMCFAHNDRLVYFKVTDELLSDVGVKNEDTEDLIEVARVVRGAEIVCRLQAVDGGVRYSLRSKRTDLPVLDIAHRLGGGGHRLAAGAFVADIDLVEAEHRLLTYSKAVFDGRTP